ncbi:MAG: nucleotidyltransferase [Saprospiraceae bacterium]|nr:nucleotidyltransferase [Saprospiraceae bacterium]
MSSENKTTLVILAAGMGSRYGGLKQLDDVGPNGETIIDYSIYDALQAGFNKLVFIIRNEFLDAFKEKVTNKFAHLAEIYFVNQDVNTPIDGVDLHTDRTKPWGTGHAVLVAKDIIREPFAVINADDFYGRNGFMEMASFLKNEVSPTQHGIIGYVLKNTLSDNGYVSRGVCQMDENHMLTEINERTKIRRVGDKVLYEEGDKAFEVPDDSPVSMNFWGFHHSIFDHLLSGFSEFAKNNTDNSKAEYFIPLVADHLVNNNLGQFIVKVSNDKWFGVTYKEDKADVTEALAKLTKAGEYPSPLF